MFPVPVAFFFPLLCFAEAAQSPTASLKQLDAVELDLRKIAKSYTKWSPSLLTFAKHVSEDVHRVVNEVEAKDSTLTSWAKSQRIAGAVWELQELKNTMEKNAGIVAKGARRKKKADQQMLHLKSSLEKQLKEKKSELQDLLKEKRQEEDAEVREIADQHAQSDIVAKLLTLWKNFTRSQSAAKAAAPGVIQALEKREQTLSLALKNLDVEEKQAVARHQKKKKEGASSIKAQMNLAKVWKEQKKRFRKAVSLKEAERKEINTAIQSIKDGDSATLEKTMKMMKRAARAAEARGGHFLHFLQ